MRREVSLISCLFLQYIRFLVVAAAAAAAAAAPAEVAVEICDGVGWKKLRVVWW